MSNSVLFTQVLVPNLISTLIMVLVSSLIATIIGFALAVVLVITNKKGYHSVFSIHYLDGGTDAHDAFHRRDDDRHLRGDRAADFCYDALCGTTLREQSSGDQSLYLGRSEVHRRDPHADHFQGHAGGGFS